MSERAIAYIGTASAVFLAVGFTDLVLSGGGRGFDLRFLAYLWVYLLVAVVPFFVPRLRRWIWRR